MPLGNKIRDIRLQSELTQKELAAKSGLSEITIRKYEANERTPKKAQLKKIADALGVNVYALLDSEMLLREKPTIGDVLTLIKTIDELVGIKFHGDRDDNGKLDPSTITMQLSNERVNQKLSDWEQIRHIYHLNLMLSHKNSDESTLIDFYHSLQKKEALQLTILANSDEPIKHEE